MSTNATPADETVLLHDGMHNCEDCGQVVLLSSNRGRELLEFADSVYCPRCAREYMDADDWKLRWGHELGLLDEIREDRSLALKYNLRGCPACYIVHGEDHVYERWMRCEDSDHENYTTIGEASVVGEMKRTTFGAYYGDPAHTVRIVNAPINADAPETNAVPMSYERV